MAQTAAADHLSRFAASAAADLIVAGTYGRRGPGHWWLRSVAERVVRAATVPVLVSRAADTPPHDVFARVALLHEGDIDATARTCAEHLANIAGGTLDGGPLAQCDAGVMHQASLVVVSARSQRSLGGRTRWRRCVSPASGPSCSFRLVDTHGGAS